MLYPNSASETHACQPLSLHTCSAALTWPFLLCSSLSSLSYPAGSSTLFFLGTAVTAHFLSGSWYLLRARTQSQPLSVLIIHQSCHLQWNAQEALGTLGPPPSSKCVLKVGMAHGEGAAQFNPGLGKGAPSLFSSPPSPLHPLALMLVGAVRRTWTMTQRLTPWCLPNESGPDEGMAPSTVCIPTFSSFLQISASSPPLYPPS